MSTFVQRSPLVEYTSSSGALSKPCGFPMLNCLILLASAAGATASAASSRVIVALRFMVSPRCRRLARDDRRIGPSVQSRGRQPQAAETSGQRDPVRSGALADAVCATAY